MSGDMLLVYMAKSNAMQYKSPAVNPACIKLIMLCFVAGQLDCVASDLGRCAELLLKKRHLT